MDKHLETMVNLRGFDNSPVTAQLFGNAAKEHMEKYGKVCQERDHDFDHLA